MRIIITGANGFLGSNFIKKFYFGKCYNNKSHSVIPITMNPTVIKR